VQNGQSGRGSAPEALEAALGDAGVVDGVLGVAVAEVVLDKAKIVASIGQREVAGMPQHVGMDGRKTGARRRNGDEVIYGLTGDWLAAFGEEQLGSATALGRQVALDGAQLVAGDGMLDVQSSLEPPHP